MIDRILGSARRYFLFPILIVACGCHIPNRSYRSGIGPDTAPVVAIADAPTLPTTAATAWPPHPEPACDETKLVSRPCIAFLEFDEFGEPWQRSLVDYKPATDSYGTVHYLSAGRPTQLDRIVDLVIEAKKQDPWGQPLILTFIHGWEHNSSAGNRSGGDDSDVIGVESTLNRLHDPKYGEWKGHVVIGIYLSWRGRLIKPYWPVNDNLSYWNREATAIRVGNSSMTDALIEISNVSKRGGDCTSKDACYQSSYCVDSAKATSSGTTGSGGCSPIVLFVGHSFGALVLERALSQALITRMESEWNEARAARLSGSTTTAPVEPLASLVIYVNSAAAATESKQVMDYLAFSQFRYSLEGDQRQRPLFLSITSEADLATGLFLKIGHGGPLLRYKWNDSMRSTSAQPPAGEQSTTAYARACYDASDPQGKTTVRTDLNQAAYYMSTTAHKQELWSHTVTQTQAPASQTKGPNDPICTPGTGNNYATCSIDQFNYAIATAPNRCNGTPYWVLQVQKELIPDHGTIFTERLISFLTAFIPAPPAPGGHVNAPQLSRPD
jgi:hypothetical protein